MPLRIPKIHFVPLEFTLQSDDVDISSPTYWQGVLLYVLPLLIILVVYCVGVVVFMILRFLGIFGKWKNDTYTMYAPKHARFSLGSLLLMCLVLAIFVISGEVVNEMVMISMKTTYDQIGGAIDVASTMQSEYPAMLENVDAMSQSLYNTPLTSQIVTDRMVAELGDSKEKAELFKLGILFIEIILRESCVRMIVISAVFLLILIAISALFCFYPSLLGYGGMLFLLGIVILLFSSVQLPYFVFVSDFCNGLDTYVGWEEVNAGTITERAITNAVGMMFRCPTNASTSYHITSTSKILTEKVVPEANQIMLDLFNGFGGSFPVGFLTNSTLAPTITMDNFTLGYEVIVNVPNNYTNMTFLSRAESVFLFGANTTEAYRKISDVLMCRYVTNTVVELHDGMCRDTTFSGIGLVFFMMIWICFIVALMYFCANGYKKYRAKFILGTFDLDDELEQSELMLDENEEEMQEIENDSHRQAKVGKQDAPEPTVVMPVPRVDDDIRAEAAEGSSSGNSEGDSSSSAPSSSGSSLPRDFSSPPRRTSDANMIEDEPESLDFNGPVMDGSPPTPLKQVNKRTIKGKEDSFIRETVDVDVHESMTRLPRELAVSFDLEVEEGEEEEAEDNRSRPKPDRQQSVLFMTFGTE